jgi:polyribonucleotide nucleotidyltransferase
MATYGGTTVLATVVRAAPREGIDFFPLTVDYREKTSAAGKFPGGFRKREGAPNEKEILTMRMIDRPIRPLFPDGFIDEVQIQVFVMSHDGENDSRCPGRHRRLRRPGDLDIPFEGPIATVRVGRIHTDDGPQFVINPTVSQLDYSDLDLVLAGPQGRHQHDRGRRRRGRRGRCSARSSSATTTSRTSSRSSASSSAKVGQEPKVIGELALPAAEITAKVKKLAEAEMTAARKIPASRTATTKSTRSRRRCSTRTSQVKTDGTYGDYASDREGPRPGQGGLQASRGEGHPPPDRREDPRRRPQAPPRSARSSGGRHLRPHARLAFFQRGETQSLCLGHLGTGKDEQIVDGLIPEYSKKFTSTTTSRPSRRAR